MFGLKTFYWQALPFIQNSSFPNLFPDLQYIYLTREDLDAQIVSLAIAWQTKQWTSSDERRGEPKYSQEDIFRARTFLAAEAKGWVDFFDAGGIQPLRLTYEQLVAQPDRVGRAICSLLSVTPPKDFTLEQAKIESQRSAINAQWVVRMRRAQGSPQH